MKENRTLIKELRADLHYWQMIARLDPVCIISSQSKTRRYKMDALETILQEKVNMVAKVLIEKYPEVAKNDPKQIGKMAKEIVFNLANMAADIVNEN